MGSERPAAHTQQNLTQVPPPPPGSTYFCLESWGLHDLAGLELPEVLKGPINLDPQEPYSDIFVGRGGGELGPTEVHILYPKNPNFRICRPKKIPTFPAYRSPKKTHTNSKLVYSKKSLCLFTTQTNPCIYHRPNK